LFKEPILFFFVYREKTTVKMAKEDNLIPFEKGKSGNPNGRPKGSKNRLTLFREKMELVRKSYNSLTGKNEEMEIQEEMVIRQIEKALEGDTAAFNVCIDSLHGKLNDKVEHTGKDGEPLRVIFQNMNESPSS
jgi:hypothetical protein